MHKGYVGLERLDNIYGGGTIPHNFPKKSLDIRMDRGSPDLFVAE